MTTIFLQRSHAKEEMVGLESAARQMGFDVSVSAPQERIDTQASLALFFETQSLGYNAFKFKKKTKQLFVNCDPPQFLKKNTDILKFDTDEYIDDINYPDQPAKPEYETDYLVIADSQNPKFHEVASEYSKHGRSFIVGQLAFRS